MLITIEGCVGVGKSTVATGLAACRKSHLLLEDFEANPFLGAFYQDPAQYAMETEFAFLLLHYHQLKRQADLIVQSEVIADFHLGKDRLYADLNLNNPRLKQLFEALFDVCSEQAPTPGLLIYLSATDDLVIDRIRQRRRDYELAIAPEYYIRVNLAYRESFERFHGKKVRIPMDQWDFVKNPRLFRELASIIDGELDAE